MMGPVNEGPGWDLRMRARMGPENEGQDGT